MTDSMILSKGKTMGGRGARWAGIALAGLLLLLAPLANAAESGATHQSANRSGALNTAEGFTLHLKADLGSVEIKTQPQGASPVVQYSVRVETDASGAVGENLLNAYTITAAAVHKGVEINAALPTHMNRAQFWVQIEVSIPSNYNLEIYTGAGDIQ